MDGPQAIQTIATLIGSLAALAASIAAIYSLNTWRKEHLGKKRVDLAEETLALFYEAKDAISAIRSPFGHSGEGKTREPIEGETPGQARIREQAHAFWERYEMRQDVFNRLRAMRYRFMAEVGKVEAEPFFELNKIVNEVLFAANNIARIQLRWNQIPDKKYDEYSDRIEEYENIVWEEHGDHDPIAERIEKMMNEIEKSCRAVIEKASRPTWDVDP